MKNNDSTLFKGAAWYYSHFRRGYPPAFFDHIIKSFNLNHNSRVLDLGTGTGQIAIPLAKNIKEVVAVDPDQEMLEEGKNQAKKEKVENIAWTQATAEDFSDSLGPFNVTTMGTSFHWMKQDEVL